MLDDDVPEREFDFEQYGVHFSPSPGAYAVIRLNPVEMVRHLEDADAIAAAQAMQTKSYLVCLKLELDLPWPDKPWYRFRVLPIGPHLPPPNEAKGYTSDMCIPIFPNTSHPTGRAPVPSERPFPYANCYYWLNASVDVRVRAREGDFDETNAVMIPPRAEGFMNLTWAEDMRRAKTNVASRQLDTGDDGLETTEPEGKRLVSCTLSSRDALDNQRPTQIAVGNSALPPSACQARPTTEEPGEGEDAAPSISSGRSESSVRTRDPVDSVTDILRIDPFTGPDADNELMPLVDLWPDIAANLKEEDIPSPLDLYREIETIQGIIQQARVRAYAALSAPDPSPPIPRLLASPDSEEFSDYGIRFSPSPGAYAVIRINAVEMVRHLGDAEALAAAKAMQTKSYLVCLKLELDLPWPDKPWYRFRVLPIAPHLPPPDEEKGYTSDMCIPIFPNTKHPTGRAPVASERPFPYSNCYYWLKASVKVRVRSRPDDFDETNAIKIPTRDEVLMSFTWAEDLQRARAAVEARQPAPDPTAVYPQAESGHAQMDRLEAVPLEVYEEYYGSPAAHAGELRNSSSHWADPTGEQLVPGDDDASSFSYRSELCAHTRNDSLADIAMMDIFTGPDEDNELMPLVDLWPDIAANLKEEDIPSPLDLYREIEAIQEIVQQARVRAYAVLTAPRPPRPSTLNEGAISESAITRPTLTRWLAPLSTMKRKLWVPARRFTSRLKHALHDRCLPKIPVWP